MSSTDKRAAGVSYCALLMVVIFEGVAIIAALVAITGTFWLGAPSFFSRPTLPQASLTRTSSLRSSGADPLVTAKGSVLPGVKNAGLWRVCYTNPEMPNLLDANTTLEEVMASSETFGLSTVVALGARDAAATDRVASDAPRRAGAPDPDGDRNVNATKFVADIRAVLQGQPPSREVCEGCTGDVRLYGDIWGHDFQDKMHATRALTLVFIFCVRSRWSTSSSVRCAAAPTAEEASLPHPRPAEVLSGWAGWLVYLWILINISDSDASRRDAVTAGFRIDLDAADDVQSYWGHSFWLFLAATAATTLGAIFRCC